MLETLFGQTSEHLESLSNGQRLHKDIMEDFFAMQAAAKLEGYELTVASGFRDFERQLAIWNGKFLGLRPIYNDDGKPIEAATLSPLQKIDAIMRFSALPGCSRHHWGTDFDYFDKAAVAADYSLQLIQEEYLDYGPFNGLYLWLIQNAADFGFSFPYSNDVGGVSAEPWHISHQASAKFFQQKLEKEPRILFDMISNEDIEGKGIILSNFDYIYNRYILNKGQLS